MAIYQVAKIKCPDCEKNFPGVFAEKTPLVKCTHCKSVVARPPVLRGDWEISYYDANGKKYKERIGKSKAMAIAIHGQRKQEILEGRFLRKKKSVRIRLSKLMAETIEWGEKNRESGTVKRYKVSQNALMPTLGNLYLEQIETLDIEKKHIARRLDRDGVSKATVNREIGFLKACFRQAIGWGYVEESPVSSIEFMKEDNLRYRDLSPEDAAKIIESAKEINFHYFADFLEIIINTGMRHSEVLSLRRSPYKERDGKSVRQNHVDFEQCLVRLWNTKGGRWREIPLNDRVIEVFRRQPRHLNYKDHFLINKNGKPSIKIQDAWEKTKEASLSNGVDVTDLHIHDLRGFFIDNMFRAGADVPTVSEITGIRTWKVLQERYTRIHMDHKKDAVRNLRNILEPQVEPKKKRANPSSPKRLK